MDRSLGQLVCRTIIYRREGSGLQGEKCPLETLGHLGLNCLVAGSLADDVREVDRLAEDHARPRRGQQDSMISLVSGVPQIYAGITGTCAWIAR